MIVDYETETVAARSGNAASIEKPSTDAAPTVGQPSSLDESLAQTFPASDPISPDAKVGNAASAPATSFGVDTTAASGGTSAVAPENSGAANAASDVVPTNTPFRFPKSVATRPTSLKELTHFGPGITSMIRLDHSHVLRTARKFRAELPRERKLAIVNTVCTALEIHGQLEEEIFYPALRLVMSSEDLVLAKSDSEHDEILETINVLRELDPDEPEFDDLFMKMLGDVMHHLADEESVLLPAAERLLTGRLGELGALMTRRRLQLVGPKIGAMASDTLRTVPTTTWSAAAGLVGLGFLLSRAFRN